MRSYEPYYYEFAEREGEWNLFPRREVINCLIRFLKPGMTLVEIGCGTGEVLAHLPPGIRYVGFEKSEFAVTEAKRRWSNRSDILFETAPAVRLPLADQSADAVLMVYALEHLRRPKEALREVGRIVKPGGIFIVVAPNLEFPLAFPNALRFLGALGRIRFHLRRMSDYIGRIFGFLSFRIIDKNYVEATGRYEKKDDDLTHVVSSWEVIRFLERSGWRLVEFWRGERLAGWRKVARFLPTLHWYGTPLAAVFQNDNLETGFPSL